MSLRARQSVHLSRNRQVRAKLTLINGEASMTECTRHISFNCCDRGVCLESYDLGETVRVSKG